MIDTKDPRLLTWGDLFGPAAYTGETWHDPAHPPGELVIVSGHPLYRYDEAKARGALVLCKKLGGKQFRASADICYMHCPGEDSIKLRDYGYFVTVDPDLPDGTIVAAD